MNRQERQAKIDGWKDALCRDGSLGADVYDAMSLLGSLRDGQTPGNMEDERFYDLSCQLAERSGYLYGVQQKEILEALEVAHEQVSLTERVTELEATVARLSAILEGRGT